METQHQHLESLYPSTARFDEIEKILGFVKKGDSCQMIAMPGVGRGNLFKFLAYNRNIRIKHLGKTQTEFHFVFINFDEIKNRPLMDALKFIFLELVSSLHERKIETAYEKMNALFKESLSYHDELVLSQGLKDAIDYLTAECHLHIIFLFERFETYLPMLTPIFFTYLRSLRNKAKYQFSVVFSVTRPLEDTVEPTIIAEFYEFFAGHTVYLTLYDKPGIAFRIEYLEKLTKEKLKEQCVSDLLQLTGGHGKLTRLAVELIFAKNLKNPSTCITDTFLLSQKIIQNTLQEIWDFLVPSEREYCLSILKDKKTEESHLFLDQIHLLQSHVFTIPLFKKFLLSTKNIQQTKNEPIYFDVSTNSIRKGNLILSDKLTSSEFRLLRFFIENSQKVLERDQVIHAVWKDSASTLGVTDQALDQLIFRLRKKIEENINNPLHIQTIKGRGIQFTA